MNDNKLNYPINYEVHTINSFTLDEFISKAKELEKLGVLTNVSAILVIRTLP